MSNENLDMLNAFRARGVGMFIPVVILWGGAARGTENLFGWRSS